jgi:integrase
MKIYKHPYTDRRTGKKKKSSKWYIGFTDNRQIRRQLPAFTSKRATERASQKIEELLSCCGVLTSDLQKWIEEIPTTMKERLVKYNIIDNRRVSENIGKPLLLHLEDFCAGLSADGRKPNYVRQTHNNIEGIIDGCRFRLWSDIDGNKVKTFLAKSRGPDGYGERTYNVYLRSFKEFCAWLLQEERVTGSDPMRGHGLLKQTEFRKKRRPLTLDEMHRLLDTTEPAPKHFNMTGHERTLIYRLGLEAGLRSGEVRTLSVLSFNFTPLADGKPATVRVESSDTKGKKSADLILMGATAQAIREYFLQEDKQGGDTAFPMPHRSNIVKMLKRDLADANIAYTDDAGRDVDFHALRHTFITNLALAGVHPAVAQKLARHSSIELTMKYYTHVLHTSEVAAIESLQSLTQASGLTPASQNHTPRQTSLDVGGQQEGDHGSRTRLSA